MNSAVFCESSASIMSPLIVACTLIIVTLCNSGNLSVHIIVVYKSSNNLKELQLKQEYHAGYGNS